MPREPSAAPFHDWNARIHAECYRANAFARIHDGAGRIEAIVDNYDRMSFNFGPTLARWLGRHDPSVAARLREADAAQRQRLGQRRRDRAGVRAPDRAAVHRARRAHAAGVGAARLQPPLRARRRGAVAARDRRCRPATLETLIDLGRPLHDPRARADRRRAGARRARTGRRSIATRSTRAAATSGGTATARAGRSRSACSTGRCRARSPSARRRTAPRACWTRSQASADRSQRHGPAAGAVRVGRRAVGPSQEVRRSDAGVRDARRGARAAGSR